MIPCYWRGLVQKNEAMVLLAAEWRCMSEAEKAPYYDRAKEVKAVYLNKVSSPCMIRRPTSKLQIEEGEGQVM